MHLIIPFAHLTGDRNKRRSDRRQGEPTHQEFSVLDEYVVKHYEHVCTKSFEEVIDAFEAAVGDGDDGKFLNGMKALSKADNRVCFVALLRPSLHVDAYHRQPCPAQGGRRTRSQTGGSGG
jgi:hypothetical protein